MGTGPWFWGAGLVRAAPSRALGVLQCQRGERQGILERVAPRSWRPPLIKLITLMKLEGTAWVVWGSPLRHGRGRGIRKVPGGCRRGGPHVSNPLWTGRMHPQRHPALR